MLAVAAVLIVALQYTPIGLRLYAVGEFPEAARAFGLRVNRLVAGSYVASSLCRGIAAEVDCGFWSTRRKPSNWNDGCLRSSRAARRRTPDAKTGRLPEVENQCFRFDRAGATAAHKDSHRTTLLHKSRFVHRLVRSSPSS
jgi:Branched-chain amino acid transport system / permease component